MNDPTDALAGCHDEHTDEELAAVEAIPEGYGADEWAAEHPEAEDEP